MRRLLPHLVALIVLCGVPPSSRAEIISHVDVGAVRDLLVGEAHLWNGGLLTDGGGAYVIGPEGRALPDPDGTNAMGSYTAGWDGFFRVQSLARNFMSVAPAARMTSISQSRAVYMNTEAYRAAPPGPQKSRLQSVAIAGAPTFCSTSSSIRSTAGRGGASCRRGRVSSCRTPPRSLTARFTPSLR